MTKLQYVMELRRCHASPLRLGRHLACQMRMEAPLAHAHPKMPGLASSWNVISACASNNCATPASQVHIQV
jgi:hypothetical protein